MQGMEEAAQKQSQEVQAVDVELKGCRKDVKKAAMQTEQTVAVLERLQGEAAMLSESSTTLRSRQGMLQVSSPFADIPNSVMPRCTGPGWV